MNLESASTSWPWGQAPDQIGWVGLGNPALTDDGVGLAVVEALRKFGQIPYALQAGTELERYLHHLRAWPVQQVVFVDAIDFGEEPGSLAWWKAEEMPMAWDRLDTHRIPLRLVGRYLSEAGGQQAWIIGIQPQQIRPGTQLTDPVRRTVDLFVEWVFGKRFEPSRKPIGIHPISALKNTDPNGKTKGRAVCPQTAAKIDFFFRRAEDSAPYRKLLFRRGSSLSELTNHQGSRSMR